MMNKLSKLFLVTIVLGIFLFGFVAAVEPFGSNVTEVETNRSDPAFYAPDIDIEKGVQEANAGNVTELTIEGVSVTQSWQGYYGNVSGTIILADSDEHRMYDWALLNPEGEVYASNSSSISWENIACFGDASSRTLEDLGNSYGIVRDENGELPVDSVVNTFSVSGGTFLVDGHGHEHGGGPHDTFYTANIEFSQGACASTHLFTAGGVVVPRTFQEVLLEDSDNNDPTHVIFVSILDQERPDGFNEVEDTYNFQMLVLENGHGIDTEPTTYYFWVELE